MPTDRTPRTTAALLSALATLGGAAVSTPAAAQQEASSPDVVIDGAPPPVAPATITRDARGRPTVRAIRLSEPLEIDGRLDEEVYSRVQSFGDLVQLLPNAGAPATEQTDVWVFFDDDQMYVSARNWDSAPPEEWVADEMRRDTGNLRQNETFGVSFDTFYDRRSGFQFYTNPLGALAEFSIVDEGAPNPDWNPVWDVRTGRFDGGWTVEMAIPFKSLRYRSGASKVWGFQVRRSIRHKNEWVYLSPVPEGVRGGRGLTRPSFSGTLVGLDLPPASRNLEIKPYAISRVTTDRTTTPAISNDFEGAIGGDLKYGVTANVTADFTVNTDFAQVEVDEQQVNLTRFSLFYPEKRDFFLEGKGLFDFGRGGVGGGGVGGGGGGTTPYLFYSRRIGLSSGRVIPIDAGGRLTGKLGDYGIGLMNIRAGEEEVWRTRPTNFTVLRLKRDILRRSTVGVMFTNRSVSTVGDGANQAFGIDGVLSPHDQVTMGGFYARTRTPGLDGDEESYQARLAYDADRYGANLEYVKIGDDFNPEVGYVRRADLRRSFASLRFSPRSHLDAVRRFSWDASLEYIEDGTGALETRLQTGQFGIEMESSDQFTVAVTRNFEVLRDSFEVSDDVVIRPGRYGFTDTRVSYNLGRQHRMSGTFFAQRGGFFDGTITAAGFTGGRISFTPQFSLEPSVSVNRVELPVGDFTATLLRSRIDYGFSPRMAASALVQYNSNDKNLSSSLRFRWEYRPGSEFFIVWTDERDTLSGGGTRLKNRALVVKVTRLLRF